MTQGIHRRWFSRIRHRHGARWWAIPHHEVRKELRRMSWRRAL
jgi:hypothetical protein